jgi:hypothetical protein
MPHAAARSVNVPSPSLMNSLSGASPLAINKRSCQPSLLKSPTAPPPIMGMMFTVQIAKASLGSCSASSPIGAETSVNDCPAAVATNASGAVSAVPIRVLALRALPRITNSFSVHGREAKKDPRPEGRGSCQ